MARRREFVRGAAAIGQKRLTSWFQFAPIVITDAASFTIAFFLNAAVLALRPFTIVRTRYEAYIQLDQTAASEIFVTAIGMAIVSDQAVAVGITAVPTLITDMGLDLWFFHKLLMGGIFKDSAAAFAALGGYVGRIEWMEKRKVDIGQDLVVVLENSAAGQGANVIHGGRMLVKVN